MQARIGILFSLALVAVGAVLGYSVPPGQAQSRTLTVYSGRAETLVSPLIESFKRDSGIDVQVRYGDTAELAATLLEEGSNSPADVFFAQDAGALGAVGLRGMLAPLPAELLQRVDGRFQSPDGTWVGVSGRARVIVYNPTRVNAAGLPPSVLELVGPGWTNEVGWAPTNGSFQAFITAMRITHGDPATKAWLQAMIGNGARPYRNNNAIVEAVSRGEIKAGLVNHYYLYPYLRDQGSGLNARNYHPSAGGPGAMINVAGAGVMATSQNQQVALRLLEFLLSAEAQQYFADQTFEYPLVEGIAIHPDLVPLAQIRQPDMNLGSLTDLEATLRLLREAGAL